MMAVCPPGWASMPVVGAAGRSPDSSNSAPTPAVRAKPTAQPLVQGSAAGATTVHCYQETSGEPGAPVSLDRRPANQGCRSRRCSHHARGAGIAAARLVVELVDLVEDLVAARLPHGCALVVHSEHLGLDQRAEEVEVGMRGQEPVRIGGRERGDLLEIVDLE